MKLARILDQLARASERYIQHAKTGHKNRQLAASIFGLCDDVRERADSPRARATAARIATDTETLIRLAHAGGREMYAAWTQHREAIAEMRTLVASETAAP